MQIVRALETAGPAQLGVSSLALLTLWKLAARLNHTSRRHTCWPSLPQICEDTGIPERTIRRVLEELRAQGLIRVTRTGRVNEYTIEAEEICRRARTPFDPNPPARQRELGPMLGDVAARLRVKP